MTKKIAEWMTGKRRVLRTFSYCASFFNGI
jgi:hypothetical protein